MAEYTYEAMGKTGQKSAGTLTASTEREAAAILDSRGLFPVRIAPAKVAGSSRSGGQRVKGRLTAAFYSQLADLLHSGVPLLRSLDILERQSTNPTLSSAIRDVRSKVADGTTLADAMRPFPNVFDELSVSMVRAGQEGGFLEDVLRRIADFTEHAEDLKSKVIGALAYPVVLAVVGFLVLNILVIFFVPRFEPIFVKLKEKDELPALTTAIMHFSHFLQAHWWWMILLFVGVIYMFRSWKRTDKGRFAYDRFKLKIPVAGKLLLSLALARFTRIFGTLLSNGIPILKALRISKDSTGNKVLAQAIEEAAENITAGKKVAEPFRRSKYFPHDVVEMIAVAEESNSLEKVLIDIANGLEKRSARQLELFVRLLEPVMLLFMAAITLVIVAGLLLPVFKMGSAVG